MDLTQTQVATRCELTCEEQLTYIAERQVRKQRLDIEARVLQSESGGKFGTIRNQLEVEDKKKDVPKVIVESRFQYDGKTISGKI